MATSLLSLALNKPLDPTIAMTGELTVTGKVLRIGGLREKTVAARRAGAKSIIFPADNTSDWIELPEVLCLKTCESTALANTAKIEYQTGHRRPSSKLVLRCL
jgi:ATP-dependent Lon protease